MQKIAPFLWFDANAEDAVNLYTSLFPDSLIESVQRYPDGSDDPHMKKMEGKILTAIFKLAGVRFMALDGGQLYRKNPSISFTVSCNSVEEVEKYWNALSEGGIVRMPLDTYPFSEKYGWCDDKFGTSWQISLGESEQKIIPSLMFVQGVAGKAHEAIQLYTSLFPESQIDLTVPYEPGESENEKEGSLKYSQFTLAGQKFVAMDSGMDHKFTFSEGISLYVDCRDQEEVDNLWNSLIADGGEESMCGWLKDKYGLSWQIIPMQLGKMMSDQDKEKAGRVMQAMLQMNKIDITKLEQAYNNQ
jgi:predicted 3-demethylubiquinone-9 3-methyltransferase (glyoxalase superfamily)